MRTFVLAATSLLLAAVAGCNAKESAPAPAGTIGSIAPAGPSVQAGAPAPAFVVFTGKAGAARMVGAVIEDASAPPVTLSTDGVDTTYVGVVGGRRAILAERGGDGSIAAIVAAGVDGKARATLATFPAGKYADAVQAGSSGDTVVVELATIGGSAHDVVAVRAGAAPMVLAADATLTAVASGRAAVLAGGNLKSVAIDGTPAIPLGGGDGHDQLVEVRGDRLLLTTHADAAGDVRSVKIDGTGAVDVGQPDVDERAVGLTETQRLVYLRKGAGGAVLVSTALDGKDEQILSTPDLDAHPIKVTAGGEVFFGGAAGGLLAVAASGGAPRVLDPSAGSNVRLGAVHAGQVLYVSDTPHWPALRAAKLDGTGVVSLLEEAPQIPFFGGVMPDGRVVYYRSLAGQLEGGHVFSVKLDGTDRRPVATNVAGSNGQVISGGPEDQDFETITPSGRLVLESEFELTGGGSQLVVGAADQEGARVISGALTYVRFAALVP
jgi:hypothetical protein